MRKYLNIFILLLLFLGCSRFYDEFELNEKTFDSTAYKMIERDTGLKLPPKSQGLNFYYHPPVDPGFLAKIRIPSDSKSKIYKQISSIPNHAVSTSTEFGAKFNWWFTEKSKILIDRTNCTSSKYLRFVLVEEKDIVFLYIDYSVI